MVQTIIGGRKRIRFLKKGENMGRTKEQIEWAKSTDAMILEDMKEAIKLIDERPHKIADLKMHAVINKTYIPEGQVYISNDKFLLMANSEKDLQDFLDQVNEAWKEHNKEDSK